MFYIDGYVADKVGKNVEIETWQTSLQNKNIVQENRKKIQKHLSSTGLREIDKHLLHGFHSLFYLI